MPRGGQLDFEKAGGEGWMAQPYNLNTVKAESSGVQDHPRLYMQLGFQSGLHKTLSQSNKKLMGVQNVP